MKSFFFSVFSWMLIVGIAIGACASQLKKLDGPFKGWIDIEEERGYITIRGKFYNQSAQSMAIRYTLAVKKSGKSGSSSNKQSGKHQVAPQEEVILSTTKINVGAKDSYKIELQIFDADTLVAEDSIIYYGTNGNED